MQIIKLRILPLYRMKLRSLVLECESVHAPSLTASILLVIHHVPETLVSLRLTSLPSITQLLLREIAGRCVNLRELELSVVQRLNTDCCWDCFEELSSSNDHSPVGGSDACSTTAGDLAVSGCSYFNLRDVFTSLLLSLDILCRVPSTSGKSETPLFRSIPVFLCRLEGAHRQPLVGERGLPTNPVHLGRFVLRPPHPCCRWPGRTSPSAPLQKIGRGGRHYPGQWGSNRLQTLHAVEMFALLGGTWTPYSQGRANGDDEASTESQESRFRSMELLVQPDEDYAATPPISVSGERQSSREVPKWNG